MKRTTTVQQTRTELLKEFAEYAITCEISKKGVLGKQKTPQEIITKLREIAVKINDL